jgi:hypothetical protein
MHCNRHGSVAAYLVKHGKAGTLSGFRQGIRQEYLDRIALVGAVAAPIGVEIATLFKLIELALRY